MNEELDVLPGDVQALLRAERARVEVPEVARARLEGRLAIGVPGFGALGKLHVPALSAAASSGAGAGAVLKTMLVVVALGAAGAAGLRAVGASSQSVPDHPRMHATTGRILAPHAVKAAVETRDVSRPVASPDAAPVVPAPVARPSSAMESLREERRLLDDARDAITRGEPERSLGPTAIHAARFPRGVLSEERDALRIRALARLGRKEEARALLERMRASYPQSFLLEGANDDVDAIP